jgi:hypothetical protein
LLLFAIFFSSYWFALAIPSSQLQTEMLFEGETDMRNQLNAEERRGRRSTTNVSKTGEGDRKKRVRKAALPQNKAAVPQPDHAD